MKNYENIYFKKVSNKTNKICICGKENKLVKNCTSIYTKTCGDKECILKLKKSTMKEKYGVEHALQSDVILNKMKEDNIEKYGVENVSQLEEIKIKKTETCEKNFGVKHPMQSKEVMNKSKKTLMDLYNVDNISKLEETIKKIQETKNKINPDTNKTMYEEAFEKRKLFYLENYNTEYYFQTEIFKQKYKKTMLKKYGVDNYWKSNEFKQKMIDIGKIRNDYDMKLFLDYSKMCRNMTNKTFNINFDILCDLYIRGEDFHLDHIYSIYDGFRNNIDPMIISSIGNLHLIPSYINLKKGIQSWITKEELMERYEKYKRVI